MSTKFDAEDKSLEEVLFAPNRRFTVPRYQRPYSWTVDEIEDLWTDLNDPKQFPFLGSLVLNEQVSGESGVLEIIDGQQRIITLTTLMAAMRDVAYKFGRKQLAKRIQTSCIAFEDKRGNQTFRVSCGESLQEFFEAYVQREDRRNLPSPSSEEHERVAGCYTFMHDQLSAKATGAGEGQAVEDLIVALWDRISSQKVIWIAIDNEDHAYTVFETVNAKGLELSVADLLKNLIFRNCRRDRSRPDFAKTTWRSIEQTLERVETDITKFIRHFWLSKHAFVSERDLYRSIKEGTTDFAALLKELETAAEDYAGFVQPAKDDFREWFGRDAAKAFNAAIGMQSMRTSQCYPLWLCLIRNRKRIPFRIAPHFAAIERFTFAYSATCKLQANRVEKLYSRCSVAIQKALDEGRGEGKAQSALDSLMNELSRLFPAQAVFLASFGQLEYKRSEQGRRFLKYLLSRINGHLSGGEIEIDLDSITIEHVYPRKPDSKCRWNRKEVKDWVDGIGNLTLLARERNGEASNKSPKAKLPILEQSKLPINEELTSLVRNAVPDWGKDAAKARAGSLAEIAYQKVWMNPRQVS